MKSNLKATLVTLFSVTYLLLSADVNAQSSTCENPGAGVGKIETTSGCTPSSCRGAKTKFGEAKVITKLRNELVALKSELEVYKPLEFAARSYDVHGIVGETDEESLAIIIKEIQLIEKDFVSKLNYNAPEFILPENKARQIQFLHGRISNLKDSL